MRSSRGKSANSGGVGIIFERVVRKAEDVDKDSDYNFDYPNSKILAIEV